VDGRTLPDGGSQGPAVSQRSNGWRVALIEPMIPPAKHGAPLLRSVGLGRHTGAGPPRALRPNARASRARSQPCGSDHRQPERQNGSKRGSALDPQGFDAGKKITGRKRHILVDTLGLLLSVVVHPANVQDRDGAGDLLRTVRRSFPFIERIFADAGYQGPRMAKLVARTGSWTLQIVKRSDAHRFVVLPKRWIVERTFAWISRNRRLARDFERYNRTVIAFFRLAMIRIMLRKLTRPNHSA
jgi:transposase